MNGLAGRKVLVTGASSGLGRAIAIHMASEGCNVAINYARDEDGALKTLQAVEERAVRGIVVQADVACEQDVARMMGSVIEQLGGIDVLVNNAGIQVKGRSHEIPVDAFDRVVAVNLRGAFLCARLAIAHFLEREKPGVIVNVTSAHEDIPKPGYIGYSASKGAMRAFTRTLALEYAGNGIRVNNVAPGAVITRMNASWAGDAGARREVEARIPLGYAADPGDVAPAVAFLASDDARYITGQTLYVDGGATLHPDRRDDWAS